MSVIPEPERPAPRRRNTFEQAAESMKNDEKNATPTPVAQHSDATTQRGDATPAPVAQRGDATPESVAQQQPVADPAPREKKRKAATTDILLSLDVDLKERMVAALAHTRPRTGITSQQMFIRVAIEQLCARLETDYNGGQEFPPPADGITL
ncbi:hypothetical protein [Prescottella subtropica]|uniref:hypothetical protein n=1 Tax=Prescottella subtropica TaxID=2545757 RepID=UPI0018840216|nr:hypothetical protein [Prescottella subtropica]